MLISPEILANNLKKSFQFDIIGALDNGLKYGRPSFVNKNSVIKDGSICFIQSFFFKEYYSKTFDSILFTNVENSKHHLKSYSLIFLFEEKVDLLDVFNTVQVIFNKFDGYERKLQNAVNNDFSLDKILNIFSDILENPVLLHNTSFDIIAASSIMYERKEMYPLVDRKTISEFANSFRLDKEYQATYDKKSASLFPSHITGVRSIYKNIFNQGKYICRVVVSEMLRGFQKSDISLLDYFSKYLYMTILRNASDLEDASVFSLSQFILKIIKKQITDSLFINEQFAQFNWYEEDEYICIKFLPNQLDIQNCSINQNCKFIESLIPGSCSVTYKSCPVVYVNLRIFNGDIDEVISKFVIFMRDNNFRAGVSSNYKGFTEWNEYLLQADYALKIGLREKSYNWVYKFSDYILNYILDRCTSELPVNMVCDKSIIKLYYYDKEHQTEYFETLKAFLENNLQPVKTAKALYIHRTTFLYRLEKIKEIVHLDFEDHNKCLYYLLSFKLLSHANLI